MNQHWLLGVSVQTAPARYEYLHGGKKCISTAFEISKKSEISLYIPRSLSAGEVYLEVYDESLGNMLMQITGEWSGLDDGFDEYRFHIDKKQLGTGLYFLRPRLYAFGECLFGHRYGENIYFNSDSRLDGMMQMTVCDFKFDEPKSILGSVIYHVFVDRFNRGSEKCPVSDGARVVEGEWEVIPEYPEYPGAPLKNNTFYGGTLYGVIEKLDYIASLGTGVIYLSPIFEAASNHKYDTADYMTVDRMFGGEAALEKLIEECDKRNIKLVLDGVFNHTGSDSKYFNRYGRYKGNGAYQSTKSKYYSWYDFQSHPDKYTSWWGIDILPRINPDKKECGEYFIGKNGVIDKYSKMGIYGFRLDVADELSDDFISKIKSRLSEGGESMLYGEVWEDASNKIAYSTRKKYYLGSELDGVMNYPVRVGIIDYLCGKGTDKLRYALTDVTANAPDRILHTQMNLLGTHDTQRILTILGGRSSEGKSNAELSVLRMSSEAREKAIKRLMTGYTILATLPGIPAIFYGDEAGLEGYSDPFNRMPYPWGRESKPLLEHYQRLGEIRKKNSVYKKGAFRLIHLTDALLVFARDAKDYSYVTVVNNTHKDLAVHFDSQSYALVSNKKCSAYTISPVGAEVFKVKLGTRLSLD